MKKLFAVLIAFSLVFAGCETETDDDNSDVIGVWTGTYGTANAGKVKLDIADGTWTLVFTDPDKTIQPYNGTWTREGNTLYLERSGSSSLATASLSGEELILNQLWTSSNSRPGTCELTRSGEASGETGGTTLKINNLSDYPLISVEFSAVNFGAIKSGKDVTKEVDAGTKYIFFVLQTDTSEMIRCRTESVTCEDKENNEIIIINNTIITITTTEESGTIGGICKKHGVKGMLYDIGDTGPGGGIVFFAEGGQYKECSGELGTYPWTNAVTTAKNHKGGGFTNWALPDRGELSLMYQNLHSKKLGGFYDNYYWSSVQDGSSYAYCQNFNSGLQGLSSQSSSLWVRAVRSFSL